MRAGGDTYRRQLRSGALTSDCGIAQAKPWMPAAAATRVGRALYTASTGALRAKTARSRRIMSMCPVMCSISMKASRECSWTSVQSRRCSQLASPGSSGSSSGRTAVIGDSRPCFRRLREDRPGTRRADLPQDIIDQKIDEWLTVCPSTEGGHNWQAMTYHPPTRQLIIPLSQSCMEIVPRKVEFAEGSGGTARGPALLRDARQRRQRRQAPRHRRDQQQADVEPRSAGAVSTAALSTAGGVVFIGDLDRNSAPST